MTNILRSVEGWPVFVTWEKDARTRVIAVDNQSDDTFRWEANPKHDDRVVAIAAARNMVLPCVVRIQRPSAVNTYAVNYVFGMWQLLPVRKGINA